MSVGVVVFRCVKFVICRLVFYMHVFDAVAVPLLSYVLCVFNEKFRVFVSFIDVFLTLFSLADVFDNHCVSFGLCV